jgi:lysylphosphatidylglycerol synthetase-like protein (DUF2156 family)
VVVVVGVVVLVVVVFVVAVVVVKSASWKLLTASRSASSWLRRLGGVVCCECLWFVIYLTLLLSGLSSPIQGVNED